jgi:hypothetical protein
MTMYVLVLAVKYLKTIVRLPLRKLYRNHDVTRLESKNAPSGLFAFGSLRKNFWVIVRKVNFMHMECWSPRIPKT